MSVEQRIRACRLLEKMQVQKCYSERLGIKDVSTFHGEKFVKMQHKEEEK